MALIGWSLTAVDDVWVHHACASDTTLVGIVLKVSVGLDSWAIGTDHHSSSPSSPRLTLPEFALASRFTPHRAKPLIHNLTVDTGQELCRHPPTLHH
ncbi:hypothetical protein D6C87_08495 [Aureobasidium pullulans]|uniref:Secreted protein n=1 Tax=Aureobasidium pullulans TaxID=5580 RepID=A0AB38LL98_AURPU|nr:hypothetical protein D6C94_10098 [Aureobasidium pullulans]THZ37436.1 hypothetical protein D6C87_08495 [Aureobasidium pullulans]